MRPDGTGTSPVPKSLKDAAAFDVADPLAPLRAKFSLPDHVTYLVGHSLGPPPLKALETLRDTAKQDWAEGLVGSWNSADWIDLPQIVGRRIAQLIGAPAQSVIVCDSVSINLFKLVGSLLHQAAAQSRLVVDASEFPTDQYIVERLADRFGAEFLRLQTGDDLDTLKDGDILVRSLVDYRTSEVADVRAIEAVADKQGFTVVWDLSHATGVLDLKLADWGAKYAVGCTYKYLNGGPGAPAFLYVDPAHISSLETPLAGWLGHARPFAFEPRYEAAEGMQRFVAGTPPILSLSALNGALEIFDEADLATVENKARCLGDMCLSRFEALELQTQSPKVGARRGGHVSFEHDHASAISQALAQQGYKTDFRTPTTIRIGLSPLFLTFTEVWRALEALEGILTANTYLDPKFTVKAKVT